MDRPACPSTLVVTLPQRRSGGVSPLVVEIMLDMSFLTALMNQCKRRHHHHDLNLAFLKKEVDWKSQESWAILGALVWRRVI